MEDREDIADILQQELELAIAIKEKMLAQQKSLTSTRGGAAAGRLAEELRLLQGRLSGMEARKAEILQRNACRTVGEMLNKQPISPKRQAAEQDLENLQMVLTELKGITAVSKRLLIKDREFAGFTINVLNQVTADVTYAPERAAAAEPLRGRKMFDQSV